MIQERAQQTFDLRREPEVPVPVQPSALRVRVDALPALAPDGEAFWREVMVVAVRVARAHRSPVHPSAIRIAAELDGIVPPSSAWWGSLTAKLLKAGWTKHYDPQRNPIASRNGAAEVYAYLPPEAS